MRLLCRLGLHRWEYLEEHHGNWTIIAARCKHRCTRYPDWRVVHKEIS